MRRVFCILSSKLDRKLNHSRRARTILKSKVNIIYGTIMHRVYGEYTITSYLGNFGACANIRYQAAFPPPRPPPRTGYEARVEDRLDPLRRTFKFDDHFHLSGKRERNPGNDQI